MTDQPKLTWLGKLAIAAVVAGCLYAAYVYFFSSGNWNPFAPARAAGTETAAGRTPSGGATRIGVAYGTEKKQWLEGAAREFAQSAEGRGITVDLIPMGSLEGAQAVLAGDQRIHVWSPASRLYEATFVRDWEAKRGGKAIVRREDLALTPMVFVAWEERYRAFVAKYGKLTFEHVRAALGETGGWDTIARRPDWGLFKFGHTHPGQSNSGLATLVAMAYSYHRKNRGLELKDILDAGFQSWLGQLQRGVTGLSNSTGNMMREMVLKGPSSFDALFVYENVAIEYLKSAEGRWGALHVVYPEQNLWNENPYCILDVPWSDGDQRAAADRFLEYLLSEPVQKQALIHGFRPSNLNVPVKTVDSPFTRLAANGIMVDIANTCEPPTAEVVENLLSSWQRQFGGR